MRAGVSVACEWRDRHCRLLKVAEAQPGHHTSALVIPAHNVLSPPTTSTVCLLTLNDRRPTLSACSSFQTTNGGTR